MVDGGIPYPLLMPRPLPPIRSLLLRLALVCVLPGMALAMVGIGYHYHSEREDLLTDTVAAARAVMAGVDERIRGVEAGLEGLAQSPQLASGQFGEFQQEALVMQHALNLRSILLLDDQGRQVVNTRIPWGAALPATVNPKLAELLNAQQATVLDLFTSTSEGIPILGVGMPVKVDGQVRYVLFASILPSSLQETLLRQQLRPTWIAAVIDRNGVIAGRTREHARYVGTAARPALVARIREVPEDAVESVTVDGVPVVTAFSRSPHTGWAVLIGIPRSELTSNLQRDMLAVIGSTVVVLLVTVALSRRMARRIAESIQSLGAAARAVGHEATLRLPAATFREAEQLGAALFHATQARQDADIMQRRTEARLRAILDSELDAIVTADENERVVTFNRGAAHMFGVVSDNAIGQPVWRLLPRPSGVTLGFLAEEAPPGGSAPITSALRWDGEPFAVDGTISVLREDEHTFYTIILREASKRPRRR